MKLDKELVREILLAIEASNQPIIVSPLFLRGHSTEEVGYHVMLLNEAGLLQGRNSGGSLRFEWVPERLTYKGHEFLDTVRDPEVWRRTKEGAERAGSAGLGVLLELGKAYGKQLLKERLGIELPG